MKTLKLIKDNMYYTYLGLPFLLFINNRDFTNYQISEILEYFDNWKINNESQLDYIDMKDIKELMEYRDWELCKDVKLDISVGVGYMAIHKEK